MANGKLKTCTCSPDEEICQCTDGFSDLSSGYSVNWFMLLLIILLIGTLYYYNK